MLVWNISPLDISLGGCSKLRAGSCCDVNPDSPIIRKLLQSGFLSEVPQKKSGGVSVVPTTPCTSVATKLDLDVDLQIDDDSPLSSKMKDGKKNLKMREFMNG